MPYLEYFSCKITYQNKAFMTLWYVNSFAIMCLYMKLTVVGIITYLFVFPWLKKMNSYNFIK